LNFNMSGTTTTTVYYTDSTSPSATLGTLVQAVPPFGTATQDRIEYALYDDSVTWNAWSNWAKQNAYDSNAMTKFSSRALKMTGHWDTMNEGDKSAMCIADSRTSGAKGALCAEAYIYQSSGTKKYESKTYSILAADVATKLPTNLTVVSSSRTMDFTSTTVSSPAATQVSVTTGTTTTTSKWESFYVFKCAVSTVKMACTNWVAAEGQEVDGGYARWTEGQVVTFWWFDGRDLSDVAKYPVNSYDKIKYNAVNLTFDNTASGASSVMQLAGLVTLVSAITSLAF